MTVVGVGGGFPVDDLPGPVGVQAGFPFELIGPVVGADINIGGVQAGFDQPAEGVVGVVVVGLFVAVCEGFGEDFTVHAEGVVVGECFTVGVEPAHRFDAAVGVDGEGAFNAVEVCDGA